MLENPPTRALFSLSLIAIAVAMPLTAQTRSFKVVVHPDNPVAYLADEQLSDLFLKRTNRWPDGVTVFPVDLGPTSAIRQDLSKALHHRSTSNVESYWQRQIFSGRDVPPPVVATDAEVVAFVRERRGGIGYVSSGASTPGVKVLAVLTPPEAVSKAPPRYTTAARRAGETGTVVLRVSVGAGGEIERVEVVRGLRFGLDDEAVAAVRKWRFKPAALDGKPVAGTVEVSVNFELE